MHRFICVVSIVLVGVLGHPRAAGAQELSGGIKVGFSAATLPGVLEAIQEVADERVKWGAIGGGFVTVGIIPRVAFQPEVLYTMKGITLESTTGGLDLEVNFDVNYLEFPLLLKFDTPSQRVYFLLGPALGLRLSAELSETVAGMTVTEDLSDQAKRLDIGLAFGGGATFGRRFFVEGRWTEGLRDLEEGDRFNNTVRNRAFAVMTGVRF